jgi:hypothetical protein
MKQSEADRTGAGSGKGARVATVVVCGIIVVAMVSLGTIRLAESVGLDKPLVGAGAEPPVDTSGAGSAASERSPDVGGQLAQPEPAEPTSDSTATPNPAGDLAQAPVNVPGVNEQPPGWPGSLPDLGEHTVLSTRRGEADQWVLAVPGNISLGAGRILAGLESNGWEMNTIATSLGVTSVGTRGEERVSITVRDRDLRIPENWVLLEVIYQARIPDFQEPASPTPDADEDVRKRS